MNEGICEGDNIFGGQREINGREPFHENFGEANVRREIPAFFVVKSYEHGEYPLYIESL